MEVALIFASMTGNTEEIAKIVGEKVAELSLNVKTFHIEFDDIMALDLKNYDAVLFGTYTWGDADLPFEVEDFYDDLVDEDLTGKVVGLFGSCDSYYPHYGAAIETMAKQFESVGAHVIDPLLKIELAPKPEDAEKIQQFVQTFVTAIKNEA
ncbi:flavodoxin [Amphibacillus sp. Q70]|uniref:flavodoxin n=1 Tax=Amphibacillus sp. Q70 TaxID=3453416 RepID=UPI003F82D54A